MPTIDPGSPPSSCRRLRIECLSTDTPRRRARARLRSAAICMRICLEPAERVQTYAIRHSFVFRLMRIALHDFDHFGTTWRRTSRAVLWGSGGRP